MSTLAYPNNLEEFQALIGGDKLIIVDFYATWCAPCKTIAPKFEAFSKIYTNAIFAKVDVDAAQDISEELNVRSMPTFMFFKNSQKLDEVVGANVARLENAIKSHL
ncbi:Allergen Cop c 2 [Endogone sp. FLAS-F59071]|nr:Allergen Cop c 2 [Endogone sp. FLAS-F59071]|eukprot:RUS22968.1 Allergen Cop c 2 [Endogone sp. FLAS-F59071]